jgi:tetratricopeptide (TPR) repeat protein
VETALALAEALPVPAVLADALVTKGTMRFSTGHPEEGIALLRLAAALSAEHDLPLIRLRALNNLGLLLGEQDRYDEAINVLNEGLGIAHQLGVRPFQALLVGSKETLLVLSGDWDEAISEGRTLTETGVSHFAADVPVLLSVFLERGEVDEAASVMSATFDPARAESAEIRAALSWAAARQARALGDLTEAFRMAESAIREQDTLGVRNFFVKEGYVEAMHSALASGNERAVERLVDQIGTLRPGERPPYLQGHIELIRALLAARHDMGAAEGPFKQAAGTFRELGVPFWLAVTLLEHGEWLSARGRDSDAAGLLEEARTIFERLRATPWLDRLDRLLTPARA